ncbi:Zinc phosphodiesterase ELAC protein 2 [Ptychographa xylographoides]|nr:Zinc phosphodiesterase ELAC protein 2 [Ptychographa xylographoides]
MRCWIQFLTTPTVDTPGTSLVLHFDNKRYIVGNVHEGLQRATIQRGTKIQKVSDIFLTGKTEWKTTGGLIGAILTLADTSKTATQSAGHYHRLCKEQLEDCLLHNPSPEVLETLQRKLNSAKQKLASGAQTLTIHGGPNVTHTLATGRRFVFRKGMPVEVDEIREDERNGDWSPTWADENILVWAMAIEPGSSIKGEPAVQALSPRKRSFTDYESDVSTVPRKIQGNLYERGLVTEQEFHDQQIRQGVISHMFDSDWRLDALFETPLSEVKMPATLFIRNSTSKKIEQYSGPMPGGEEPLPNINVLVRKPWPGALITDLPPTKPSLTAISYIIRNHPQRGKFDPKKAKALGVVAGRLYSDLTAGHTVQNDKGEDVLPEQVLGPSKSGNGIAVVELPSDEYVHNLIARAEWQEPQVMEGVGAIVWILGPGVFKNQSLQYFMTEMSHMKHMVSSTDCCPNYLSLDSSAAAAIRLHQIDADRFPIPTHNNRPPTSPENDQTASTKVANWIPANRGLRVLLEPTILVQDKFSVPPLDTAKVLQEMPKDVLFLAKAIRHEISGKSIQQELERSSQDLPSPDAEVVFLGTGSALPSKYRNVSGILLRVPGSGSYLFDCGENSLGQLSRIYPQDELTEVLRDLKMIWISHMHADHHLGTTSVVKAWYKATYGENYPSEVGGSNTEFSTSGETMSEGPRLFVVSDEPMLKCLAEYSSVEDFGYDKLVPLSVWAAKPGKPESTRLEWNGVPVGFNTNDEKMNQMMRTATGLTSIAAANVPHCHGAKGVAVTFASGFKFTYSGDCRPCRALVEIGMGSTILVHEATFDDELRGDAIAKLHSTISEAIGVGIAMKARRVLLTHFSQRYQKLPVMDGVESVSVELEDETDGQIEGTEGNEMGIAPIDTDDSPVEQREIKSIGEMVEDEADSDELLAAPPANARNRRPSILKINQPIGRDKEMKVGVAFDYMRVKLRDIALLEKFTPALLKLYEDTSERDSIGSQEETTGTPPKKQETTQEKRTKKVGGGKMGRVRQSSEERKNVRNGVDLFSD